MEGEEEEEEDITRRKEKKEEDFRVDSQDGLVGCQGEAFML